MSEIPPEPPFDWIRVVAVSAFAAVGGAIGAVLRAMDASQPLTITQALGRALVEFFAAGFVGALSSLLCSAWGLSILWTAFVAGTFGMLGARASIQVMQRFVWQKFGLNRSAQDGKPDQ